MLYDAVVFHIIHPYTWFSPMHALHMSPCALVPNFWQAAGRSGMCACVFVSDQCEQHLRHTPKEKVGGWGAEGWLDDVWPGSWELLRAIVSLWPPDPALAPMTHTHFHTPAYRQTHDLTRTHMCSGFTSIYVNVDLCGISTPCSKGHTRREGGRVCHDLIIKLWF